MPIPTSDADAAVVSSRAFSRRFAEALVFAEELHAYRRRKGTTIPHLAHLLGVSSIVINQGCDEDEAIAALLHDAPDGEGGAVTLCRVRDRFGERVANITGQLCEGAAVRNHAAGTWLERKRAYISHLRACIDRSVHLVSAADRLDDARSMAREFGRLGESFWQRFNSGKPGQLWYLEELLAVYRSGPDDARREPIVDELAHAIEHINATSPAAQAASH